MISESAASLKRLSALLLVISLLAMGLASGFARMGWADIRLFENAAILHGPLMIGAFFGTVISVERAVALGRSWAGGAPLAAAASGVMMLLSWPWWLAQLMALIAALMFIAVNLAVLRLQRATHTMVLLAAAACWLMANLAWIAGHDPSLAAPWWLAFLIVTIAGERLELSRLVVRPGHANRLFAAALIVLIGGALVMALDQSMGLRIFSWGCLALAVWLMRYDIARHNIQQRGITRYIAACLLSGYGWLAVGGALGMAGAMMPGHGWRDAALHAITLGFVVTMVFGHALIIVPAVLRIRIAYHPVFYVPLALLHGSLLIRVIAGLGGEATLQHAAAAVNVASLMVFALLVLWRRQTTRPGASGNGWPGGREQPSDAQFTASNCSIHST